MGQPYFYLSEGNMITIEEKTDIINVVIRNSVIFVFDKEAENFVVGAIYSYIRTPDIEKQSDVLNRFYVELPYGEEGKRVRVTKAHYAPNRYIISTHEKAN